METAEVIVQQHLSQKGLAYVWLDIKIIFLYNEFQNSKIVDSYPKYPGVAQLVARLVRDQEAVGSNPATRTM